MILKKMSLGSGSTVGRILCLTWPGILARGCSLREFIHVALSLRTFSSCAEFIASTPPMHCVSDFLAFVTGTHLKAYSSLALQ